MTVQTNDSKYGVSDWIVDTGGIARGATHTTIATAITSASSGDNIFVRPGTYTENLTLKAGVNIIAFECDSFGPQVNIVGKLTASYTGTSTITGIRLTTNSDNFLLMNGSNATVLTIKECFLNCSTTTGMSITNSNADLTCENCSGDIGTTGISLFAITNGSVRLQSLFIENSGSSITASTITAGSLIVNRSAMALPITTSGTASLIMTYSQLAVTNTKNLICGGSGNHTIIFGIFQSGTAVAITVSNNLDIYQSNISSGNGTSAIDGAGTITYGLLTFSAAATNITTSTKVPQETLTGPISFDNGTNFLDDYKEGSFTPTFTRTGLTFGYTTQIGRYTKVGNMVTIWARVTLSSVSGAGSGNLVLSDLPFTISNISGLDMFGSTAATVTTLASPNIWAIGAVINTTTAAIYALNASTGAITAALTPNATHNQWFTLTYRTDA